MDETLRHKSIPYLMHFPVKSASKRPVLHDPGSTFIIVIGRAEK